MRIVIIGAGASGLMAAVTAARAGAAVTVLEQNEKPGRKLLATGNGRCNLTNLEQLPEKYRSTCREFPAQARAHFGARDAIAFFSESGVYTKIRNGWIYPNSDQAASVLEVLLMEAEHLKVKIKTRETVIGIDRENGGFAVRTSGWSYPCDRVILTTGSPASSIEGSCDSGKTLAAPFGHSWIPMLPALCGLRGSKENFAAWAGVRMEGEVTLILDGVPIRSERGELQCTDYGISGIPVFQISRYAVRALAEHCPVSVRVDFFPDMEEEFLIKLLHTRQKQCSYKTPRQSLTGLLPEKLIRMFWTKGTDFETLARRLKGFTFPIKGASSLAQAQVCSGGIPCSEVCPDTMESRLQRGLYFAGETLDVDGACGGYNLQWAWTSGFLAGSSAAEEGTL